VCVLTFASPALPAAAPPADARFAAGPYLLDVTANQATVAVHLHRPAVVTVTVFDSKTQLATFRSAPAATRHFVRITGLSPGQTYRYEVTCGPSGPRTPPGDRRYQIRTAVRPGEAFTFAVYGDCRPGETGTQRHHRDVMAQVAAAEPSHCLILGDVVDDGTDAGAWNAFFDVERNVARRAAMHAVMGDNDYAKGKGLYAKYFPKLDPGYYHFESGGVHFFALRAWDARGAQPRGELAADSQQARWLTKQLARDDVRKAPYRVVFMHDPVYICRGRSAAILRDVWAPIFSKGGVDVVFASWHMYERSFHGGVHYVLTGGAGAELVWMGKNPVFPSQAEARRHHFCRVDVNAAGLTVRAVADDGTVLDSIALSPRSATGQAAQRLARLARRLGRKTRIVAGPPGAPALPVHLFSSTCDYCRTLTQTLLPRWAAEHHVTLEITTYDVTRPGAYDLLQTAGADFARQNTEIPTIFVGRTALGGPREIEAHFPRELDAFARSPQAYLQKQIVPFQQARDVGALKEQAFNALTAAAVVGAGLLDGINPCAFTTIVFLISYLGLVGSGRRQMLLTGAAFTLGVFAAYMVMGMFLFQLAAWLQATQTAGFVLNAAILAVLVVLAALSAVDFVRCRRGKPGQSMLQLPAFLKGTLRARIRHFARNRRALAPAALALGAVVAALELACTGQVYLPIVTMIADPAHRAAAMGYLLIYNLAFIAPLITVFLLAAFGVTSQRMAATFQRHLASVKLAMALLFLALAAALAHTMALFS